MSVRTYQRCNSGFSLIEVLATLAILSILVSLLLVGIQAVREASRKMGCQNNLRQVGIAMHNQRDTPDIENVRFMGIGRGANNASFQARLLPFLEHEWILRQKIPVEFVYDNISTQLDYSPAFDVDRKAIGSFLCPSDGSSRLGTNYRVNKGPDAFQEAQESGEGGKGPFQSFSTLIWNTERGLSNVIALSERLRSNQSRLNSLADIWFAGIRRPADTSRFINVSFAAIERPPTSYYLSSGLSWYCQQPIFTSYNHVSVPNSNQTSLVSSSWGGRIRFGFGFLIGASSYHSGGVTTLRLDGSVHFVDESIDELSWRRLGTR